jgi:mannose-1-phosphate guanylyltransferase
VNRWAVILAGGIGSRFWPLSTPARPKQLLPLVTDKPLLVDAIERVEPLVSRDRILILTGEALAERVAAVSELPADNIIAEPFAAGTAAALAWGAKEVLRRGGADAVMISLHADWAIGDPEGFRKTLQTAVEVAETHRALVTVGIVPDRPDPGFGYIRPGGAVDRNASKVERFVEKPTTEAARVLIHEGCLWNSGIFVWRASDFLGQVAAVTPEVSVGLEDGGISMRDFFNRVTPISVDVGVLERSDQVLVVPGDFGWDDVGTWGALHRVRRADISGNASAGSVHSVDAANNVVHAESTQVVLFGVSDLVVVSKPGLTLVTTVEKSAELKSLVDSLPPRVRDLA